MNSVPKAFTINAMDKIKYESELYKKFKAVYKTQPGLYIHKNRLRPFFLSKKVNKIRPSISARPYIFIHIFNLNDEYCNEFYLIFFIHTYVRC